MQIEIEKKYNLTESDHSIIIDKCEFIQEVVLKDYYLDKDLILAKNQTYLRLRNWIYELKIINFNPETQLVTSEEYNNEDEIEKILSKYWISTDDVTGIMFIETTRNSYKYDFKWYSLQIELEKYQYWTRYEIEIVYQEEWKNIDRQKKEIELNWIIEDFRCELGLSAESDINSSKTITCAMHQNIDLYEIMTKNIIK